MSDLAEDDLYQDLYGDGGESAAAPSESQAAPAASHAPQPAAVTVSYVEPASAQASPVQPSQQHGPPQTSDAGPALASVQQAQRVASHQAASTSGASLGATVAVPQQNGTGAPTTSVYIGSLQWWTTDAQLEALCSEFGEVLQITTYEDKANGKSKGYALVEFATFEAAQACKEQFNGREISGKACVVTYKQATPAARPASVLAAPGRSAVVSAGLHTAAAAAGVPGIARPAGLGMFRPHLAVPGASIGTYGSTGMHMPYASMAMRPSAPIPNLGMPLHPGYAALMQQQQQMSMGMQGMGMQGMGASMATLPFNPLPGMGIRGPAPPPRSESDDIAKRARLV